MPSSAGWWSQARPSCWPRNETWRSPANAYAVVLRAAPAKHDADRTARFSLGEPLPLLSCAVRLARPVGEPFRTQDRWPRRIALFEKVRVLDAVHAEGAELLPQFAPSDQQSRRIEIGDHRRPDHAFSLAILAVAVDQRDLATRLHPCACLPDIDGIRRNAPARRRAGRGS